MSHLTNLVTSAVLAEKNIVITTTPGVGTVTSILDKFKEDGLKVTTINLAYDDSDFYGLPFLKDGVLDISFPEAMLNADVMLFDQAHRATPTSISLIKNLMDHRTIHMTEFPNLKTVIVVYTENGESTETPFANTAAVSLKILK